MKAEDLTFGQTPWDDLSREEMLLTIWRMWAAITSLYSALNVLSAGNPYSPYWGKCGSGGVALEKGRQVCESVAPFKSLASERIYRQFFRYATDLLFQDTGYRIGFGWSVCPVCDRMFGASKDGTRKDGQRCGDILPLGPECNGILRPLQWSDLRPEDDYSCGS